MGFARLKNAMVAVLAMTFVGVLHANAMELDNLHWHVYGRPITLRGTITEHESYKSSDAQKIEKQYLLKLDKPINVRGIDNSQVENDVSELQLKINWHGQKTILPKGNFSSLLERKVSVRGSLFHNTESEAAKLQMSAQSIKPYKKPSRGHKKHKATTA